MTGRRRCIGPWRLCGDRWMRSYVSHRGEATRMLIIRVWRGPVIRPALAPTGVGGRGGAAVDRQFGAGVGGRGWGGGSSSLSGSWSMTIVGGGGGSGGSGRAGVARTLRCAYCGDWQPYTSAGFPVLLYAKCWRCAERDWLRDARTWAARRRWRRRRPWGTR